jgi:trimethylamine--corrinoid protein Co-methyltransferase
MEWRSGDSMPCLTQAEAGLVHQKSLELLSRIGFRFSESARAIDIFRRHDFRVDGDVVYFSERQIAQALATIPSSFLVRAPGARKDFVLGKGLTVFSNAAAPAFIHDAVLGRRLAEKDDFIAFLMIAQQLPLIKLIRPMFDVADKPAGKFSWLIRWALEYSDKAISGSSLTDLQLVAAAFDLSKKAMRRQASDGTVHVVGVCNPKSPLTLERSNTDFCIDQADWGAAIKISPVPVAGMTGPVSLPGLIILQNAEILGPLVLAQLVNPGVPVLYGVLATTTDFRSMNIAAASPELTGALFRAGTQMAAWYGLPSRVDVCNTNACSIDWQAGAESSLMLANALWSGADLCASLGSLESRGIGSLDKLVLDHDLAYRQQAWLSFTSFDTSSIDGCPCPWLDAHGGSRVQDLLESYEKPTVFDAAKLARLDAIIQEGNQ